MDRTLTESLQELARRILTPTREMEGGAPGFYRQTLRELAADRTLETLTRESLPAPKAAAPAALPTPVPATRAALPVQPPPKAPQPSYSSGNAQYRVALSDESLIEALLKLSPRSGTNRPPSRAVIHAGLPAESQGFAPADIPEIEVETKPGSAFSRRTAGVFQTILRTRR